MTITLEAYAKNLPVMPAIAAKILRLARDGVNVSFAELEQTVRVDPGLTAKILKLANSALYGRQKEIGSLQLAISLLGFKNIRNVVVLITASNFMDLQTPSRHYREYWRQAVSSAFLAKRMSRMCGLDSLEEEAFLGALLHNIGQLAFLTAKPDEYKDILEEARHKRGRLRELEREWVGIDHLELGACVMELWNFPQMYCDIAREHGNVEIASRFNRLTMLVGMSGFLANNLLFHHDDPHDLALVQSHASRLGLSKAATEALAVEVSNGLFEDPFYKECVSFFERKAA